MKRSSVRRAVLRIGPDGEPRPPRRDHLATEEPMETRVRAGRGEAVSIAVTMRTPGADFDLAAGYLHAEGIVAAREEVVAIRYCVDGEQRYNVVTVDLAEGAPWTGVAPERRGPVSSACGVCGKATIDAAMGHACPRIDGGLRIDAQLLLALPARLRAAQEVFERTGGLHAAALFDAEGALLRVREDVGRHNALDKLVGASLLAGELPLSERVVLVSGRLSYELVQKAARAGVALLAGVSAPSSLAVELAERAGVTLVGFLRESGFNLYTGAERIVEAAPCR
jgi:FdhD protein